MCKFALVLLFSVWPMRIWAVVLSPTVTQIDVDKRRSSQITLTNNSTTRLPVEIAVLRLKFAKDGNFSALPEERGSIIVIPSAAIIDPGMKQVFRLLVTGNYDATTSASYFIRFTPLQLQKTGGGEDTTTTKNNSVRVKVNYNTLVHVFARTQSPEVILHVNEKGQAQIENSGSKYTYVSELGIEAIKRFTPLEPVELLDELFLPPQTRIPVDLSVTLPPGDYNAHEK